MQIDNDQITINDILNDFFRIKAHQNIKDFTELLQAAEGFLRDRPMVDKKEFMEQIREYARLQRIIEENQAEEVKNDR